MKKTEGYNPRNFNLISVLLEILNTNDKNNAYFTIAEYMLEHFSDLSDTSIYKIAEKCFVSRSTIQRFIKYIGFDSFTSLKNKVFENQIHSQSYVIYAHKTDFKNYLKASIDKMMEDMDKALSHDDYKRLTRLLCAHSKVYIAMADNYISMGEEFQKEMLSQDKLIRLITNKTTDLESIKEIDRADLFMVISVTGNYAHANKKTINDIKAHKVLLTINRNQDLSKLFDEVIYLSTMTVDVDKITRGTQNAFTKYGVTYFLDQLFSAYADLYDQ